MTFLRGKIVRLISTVETKLWDPNYFVVFCTGWFVINSNETHLLIERTHKFNDFFNTSYICFKFLYLLFFFFVVNPMVDTIRIYIKSHGMGDMQGPVMI